MIPSDVVSKLVNDAPLYKKVLDPYSCLAIYFDMMNAHKVKIEKKKLLKSLIKEARKHMKLNKRKDHVVYDCTSI